ncbi:MAG: hypothetical protein RML72_05190 [Bacteroidia bacterium]|nr:hypothetical protein [Bacteroidia bacterium]
MRPLVLLDKCIHEKLTLAEKAWLINQSEKYPYFSLLHFIQARNATLSEDTKKTNLQALGAIYATDRLRYAEFIQAIPSIGIAPFPEIVEADSSATTASSNLAGYEQKLEPEESIQNILLPKLESESLNTPPVSVQSTGNIEEIETQGLAPPSLFTFSQEEVSGESSGIESPILLFQTQELGEECVYISRRLERLLLIAINVHIYIYSEVRKQLSDYLTAQEVNELLQIETSHSQEFSQLQGSQEVVTQKISSELQQMTDEAVVSQQQELCQQASSLKDSMYEEKSSLTQSNIQPEVDDELCSWEVPTYSLRNAYLHSLQQPFGNQVSEAGAQPVVDPQAQEQFIAQPISNEAVIEEFVKIYENSNTTDLDFFNRDKAAQKSDIQLSSDEEPQEGWYSYLQKHPLRTSSFDRFVEPDFANLKRTQESPSSPKKEFQESKEGEVYLNRNFFLEQESDTKENVLKGKDLQGSKQEQNINLVLYESATVFEQFSPTAVDNTSVKDSAFSVSSQPEKVTSESMKRFILPDFGPEGTKILELHSTDSEKKGVQDQGAAVEFSGINTEARSESTSLTANPIVEPISSPSFRRFVVPDFGTHSISLSPPAFQESISSDIQEDKKSLARDRTQNLQEFAVQSSMEASCTRQENGEEAISNFSNVSESGEQSIEVCSQQSAELAEWVQGFSSEQALEQNVVLISGVEKVTAVDPLVSHLKKNEEEKTSEQRLPQPVRTESFNRFVEPDFASNPFARLRLEEKSFPLEPATTDAEQATNAKIQEYSVRTEKENKNWGAINYKYKNWQFEIIVKPEHAQFIAPSEVKEGISNFTSSPTSAPEESITLQAAECLTPEGEMNLETDFQTGQNLVQNSFQTATLQDTVPVVEQQLKNSEELENETNIYIKGEADFQKEVVEQSMEQISTTTELTDFFSWASATSTTSVFSNKAPLLEEDDYYISTEALLATSVDERIDRFKKNLDRIRKKSNPLNNVDINILEFQQRFLETLAQTMSKPRINVENFVQELDLAEEREKDNPNPTPSSTSIDDLLERFKKFEPTIYQNIEARSWNSTSTYSSFQILENDIEEEQEENEYVTETLAKIHIKQGNKEKAIKIYKKLMLKFPEKSSYFEKQIQQLKES